MAWVPEEVILLEVYKTVNGYQVTVSTLSILIVAIFIGMVMHSSVRIEIKDEEEKK